MPELACSWARRRSSRRMLRDATTTIPTMASANDLVGVGFARSMARHGGNVTGVSILATELDAKRLEILRGSSLPRSWSA